MLSDTDFRLDNYNSQTIAKTISKNLKQRRLELNITQDELSHKTGVSLGSIKRFESKYEISLKHLLLIAIVLDATEEFLQLFTKKQYLSISEVINETKIKSRKRARKSDK
jgi:transcriptional regulator with XRE-family HTH domain